MKKTRFRDEKNKIFLDRKMRFLAALPSMSFTKTNLHERRSEP